VGHQNGVFGIQFDDRKMVCASQKNHYLPSDFIIHQVSCAGDHTIKIWDLHSKECLATLDEHRDAIRAIQYDESKIVRTLISPSLASLTTKKIGVWVIHKR